MLFITNRPAFYKIKLYNEIARHKDIFVLFTNNKAGVRNKDFYDSESFFNYSFWQQFTFVEKIKFFAKLLFDKSDVAIGGWDCWLNWVAVFLSPRQKNAVVIESSYLESTCRGWKAILKRIFLARISRAYCSGKSNARLMECLNFKGEIIITKGVGLYRRQPQPIFAEKKDAVKKFLYVGRLSEEKNLKFLISVFNDLPEYTLSIAGFGPQEEELKKIAKSNIEFLGTILNKDLPQIYKAHDVFILFSTSEPWGLVVEEAMNNGLPVIVSEHVGCAEEIISDHINGLVVPLDNPAALQKALHEISHLDLYNKLKANVCNQDYEEIENYQIKCYL